MTVRGGGVPCRAMAFVPPLRMGPPPRSSPPMRMRASWFGSLRSTGYKVAARVHHALTAGSPRMRHPDHNKRANVLEAVKAPDRSRQVSGTRLQYNTHAEYCRSAALNGRSACSLSFVSRTP
jgi:hypothetical protein